MIHPFTFFSCCHPHSLGLEFAGLCLAMGVGGFLVTKLKYWILRNTVVTSPATNRVSRGNRPPPVPPPPPTHAVASTSATATATVPKKVLSKKVKKSPPPTYTKAREGKRWAPVHIALGHTQKGEEEGICSQGFCLCDSVLHCSVFCCGCSSQEGGNGNERDGDGS